MTTMTFRRPTALPIHPQTWVRPSGNTDFRVTQRFAVPDSFYGGRQQHNAVDLGNFSCGGAVVAMAPGVARRTQDNATALGAKTNALGVIVDHGNGIASEYWHLNGYSVASGVRVSAGQQIGLVGRTGLGDVCHLHVEVKRNGVRIDPEPLMFGTPLNLEDDMRFGGSELSVLKGAAQFRLNAGANFRDGRTLQSAVLQTFPAGTPIYPAVSIDGESVGGNDQWAGCFMYVGSAYVWGHFHTSVIDAPAAPVAADCSKQDQELAVIRTKLARAATSAVGAAQAATATVEALR
jgi:hypothetical protein